MIGYKGFDKAFCCRGMQYEVGKTYRHDGELKICDSGFHFCINPNDIFSYYPPANSRFALIEATGNIVEGDDKCCTDELTIVRELSLTELIATVPGKHKSITTGNYSVATNTKDYSSAVNTGYGSASVNTGYRSAATNTGDCSAATNTGNYSTATNTGDCSAATNTGDYSTSEVTGKHSLAVATGFNSIAKGSLGCWLVLADWRDNEIADMQIFKVDGEYIKPDTFYKLKDGQLTEVQS